MTALGQPRFLTLQEVLTLHETAIDEHGGSHGIRDQGLLESALAMPRQGFGDQFAHEFPFGMAAAYAYHICKNHPFVDGNKRTAFAAMVVFLRMNGWSLVADESAAADRIFEIATGVTNKEMFAAWLSAHTRQRPTLELRRFFSGIRAEEFISSIQSLSASSPGARVAEVAESHAEAEQSFPFLVPVWRSAYEHLKRADAEADPSKAREIREVYCLLMGVVSSFTTIHRIAEDMGYEW